jgi:hypothetical protein
MLPAARLHSRDCGLSGTDSLCYLSLRETLLGARPQKLIQQSELFNLFFEFGGHLGPL